jgi:hypothetical protein
MSDSSHVSGGESGGSAGGQNTKFLTYENLSPAVKSVQYAIRGLINTRATELEKELKEVI